VTQPSGDNIKLLRLDEKPIVNTLFPPNGSTCRTGPISFSRMRLHHSQDGSTYPRYKLMCFVYFSFFHKEQNALAFNRDTWCHLASCLQMIPSHFSQNGVDCSTTCHSLCAVILMSFCTMSFCWISFISVSICQRHSALRRSLKFLSATLLYSQ
jgi:hypothetical protein